MHRGWQPRNRLSSAVVAASHPPAARFLVCILALLASGALTLPGAAGAAAGWSTYAVDDSQSQVQAPAAQLRWRQALPSREGADLLEATMAVRIVLNVSPWVGRPARIYMVMPPLMQSSLVVEWTTAGLLQPGRLASGQRHLVFQGVVPGVRIEDTMRVTAVADARDRTTPQRVNFSFEIEVPSR